MHLNITGSCRSCDFCQQSNIFKRTFFHRPFEDSLWKAWFATRIHHNYQASWYHATFHRSPTIWREIPRPPFWCDGIWTLGHHPHFMTTVANISTHHGCDRCDIRLAREEELETGFFSFFFLIFFFQRPTLRYAILKING